MSENFQSKSSAIPSLTLEPTTAAPATAQPAPKMVQPQEPQKDPLAELREGLSPEEQQTVEAFAQQIDVTNSNQVLQYGSAAQQKIADFSDSALQNVRTKDLGEVGDMITDLMVELKGFEVEEQPKGILGFFKKSANQISALKTKYDKAEVNVNRIVDVLEQHQVQLMKDIALLDQLYDQNVQHYKELSMYILAGKIRLQEVRETVLPEMEQKAKLSGKPEDAQAANDMASFCDRFEKKLHDLELTRMVSIQMGPQIRLVQNNDTLMTEKIRSTIVNTIPLWKSQMVIAMGVSHSQQALQAEREVNNMTNSLLQKNADMLKMATIETAKESERSVIDIETLRHTNQSLIETLDEVVKIQDEGRARRREAEQELVKLEQELKQKLLEIHQ
jgi:uncharacterized protein YaaN involved in tellurite resistance